MMSAWQSPLPLKMPGSQECNSLCSLQHSTKKGRCQDPIAPKNHQLLWWLFHKRGAPAVPCASQVLNLRKQVGIYLSVQPYPFRLPHPLKSSTPFSYRCWLKTVVASRTQQGTRLYTNTESAKRQILPIRGSLAPFPIFQHAIRYQLSASSFKCNSANCSPVTGEGVPVIRSIALWVLGKAITSRMLGSLARSITSRSMPGAIPP